MLFTRLSVSCLAAILLIATTVSAQEPAKPRFTPDKPARVVIIGGSISVHPANYGKFIAYGCKNVGTVNFGRARLKAKAILRRFEVKVLADKALMAELEGKKPWLLYLGGLNGVYAPERTRANIIKTVKRARARGFRIMALTLPPWGSLEDGRFFDFEGLFNMRATALVNDYLTGVDKRFDAATRPDVTIDIFNSKLRDSRAKKRDAKKLAAKFPTSRYKRRKGSRRRLIRQAREVPRMFMKKRYRGRYHFHPNWRGHRLIAGLICSQAPADWGCDCAKISRAWSKKGRIRP